MIKERQNEKTFVILRKINDKLHLCFYKKYKGKVVNDYNMPMTNSQNEFANKLMNDYQYRVKFFNKEGNLKWWF